MTKVRYGDELKEINTGHIWRVTGQSLKGGLPHFTVTCTHPGRQDACLVLCESGLFMRFTHAAQDGGSHPFSFRRIGQLVRPFSGRS